MVLLVGPAAAAAAEQSIAPADLQTWLAGDDPPLVIDVRGRAAYRAGTLAEALDAGQDPAGYLPDGRGGAVVLLAPLDWKPAVRRRWLERLEAAGHAVYRLEGDAAAWQAAGLAVIVPDASYVKPGTVPFLVPRGLCEANEPAHRYR